MYAYYSFAADWAEPLLLQSTWRSAAKHGIQLKVKSWEHWGTYRMSLKRQSGPVILSTHGSPTSESTREDKQWEFSSLRRDEKGRPRWYTVAENFSSDEPFNARLLIVFACHAEELDWKHYIREGSFAIVSKGDLTTAHCASALATFWDRVPNFEGFDLTHDNLVAAWSDGRFAVIPGSAPK